MNQIATLENEAQVIQIDEIAIIKELNIQEIQQANIELMKEQILEIPAIPKNKEQYDKVYRYHVDSKALPKKIEDRRVEIKKKPLEKCRLIDDVAKKAKAMVQPLIELSGDRRFAWEKIKEAERAAKAKIETDRLEKIEWMFGSLTAFITVGQKYNLTSGQISKCIDDLNKFEVSFIDFEDQTEAAEALKISGLESLKRILVDRLKWESAQEEQAKIQAAQEAEAKKLAVEKAEFEAARVAEREKQAIQDWFNQQQNETATCMKIKDVAMYNTYISSLKAQTFFEFGDREQEAREYVDALIVSMKEERDFLIDSAKDANMEAKKLRLQQERLERERKDLEDQRVEIKAREEADKLRKYLSDWYDAIEINRVVIPDSAVTMNIDFDQAKVEDKKAMVQKLKSDNVRAGLVGKDKKKLQTEIDQIDTFISNVICPGYSTDEAAKIIANLYVKIKTAIYDAEKAGRDIV